MRRKIRMLPPAAGRAWPCRLGTGRRC